MTIHEVSKLAGVSVRTLHHYDAIGLLPPTALTGAGYRLYDDTALARLQSILLFRELEFPLKDIKRILDDPNFDQSAALEDQQREENGSAGDSAELMAQFTELGKLKNLAPATPEVQNAIRKLQQFITDHFYTCTPEILAGLGEMYVADERFRENIDKTGGEGTAAFISKAIAVYCGK